MFECSEQLLFSCVSSKVSICNHSLSLSHSHSFSLLHSFNLSLNHSRHAEQLLFSSLCSKLTLTLSHSHTLSISHSITLDMLNNFCFHVYAQKSLFIGKKLQFFDISLLSTLTCYIRCHRAGSQLKNLKKITYFHFNGNLYICNKYPRARCRQLAGPTVTRS